VARARETELDRIIRVLRASKSGQEGPRPRKCVPCFTPIRHAEKSGPLGYCDVQQGPPL
jgi:hypothetical protein